MLIEVLILWRWGCYSFLETDSDRKKETNKQRKCKCKLLVINNLKLYVRFLTIKISLGLDIFSLRCVIGLPPQTRCRYRSKTVYTIYLYIPAWNDSIEPPEFLTRSINLNLVNKRLVLEVTPVCSTQWSFRVPPKCLILQVCGSAWERMPASPC